MESFIEFVQARINVCTSILDVFKSISNSFQYSSFKAFQAQIQNEKREEQLRIVKENNLLDYSNDFKTVFSQNLTKFLSISYTLMQKIEPKFIYEIQELVDQEKGIISLFVSFFKTINMEDKIKYMMTILKGNYFTNASFYSLIFKLLIGIARTQFQEYLKEAQNKLSFLLKHNFFRQFKHQSKQPQQNKGLQNSSSCKLVTVSQFTSLSQKPAVKEPKKQCHKTNSELTLHQLQLLIQQYLKSCIEIISDLDLPGIISSLLFLSHNQIERIKEQSLKQKIFKNSQIQMTRDNYKNQFKKEKYQQQSKLFHVCQKNEEQNETKIKTPVNNLQTKKKIDQNIKSQLINSARTISEDSKFRKTTQTTKERVKNLFQIYPKKAKKEVKKLFAPKTNSYYYYNQSMLTNQTQIQGNSIASNFFPIKKYHSLTKSSKFVQLPNTKIKSNYLLETQFPKQQQQQQQSQAYELIQSQKTKTYCLNFWTRKQMAPNQNNNDQIKYTKIKFENTQGDETNRSGKHQLGNYQPLMKKQLRKLFKNKTQIEENLSKSIYNNTNTHRLIK